MEGIASKEVLTCRPLDLTDVQRKPAPKAIMEAVKCCVCLKDSIGPVIPSRFCQDASHPICDPCFSAYRKVVGHPEPFNFKCPSLEEDGQICGSPVRTVDRNLFGIALHSDYLAKERNVFPCVAAALFECKFVGSYQEMVEHMKSNCIFRYLLLCNRIVNDDEGTTCNKMFETPKMLHEHQKKEHDFEFSYHSEFSVKLGFNDSKAGRRVGNKWMMLRRVPIDIDGQHFCMLIVDENKTCVRMWLCEIGPKISEGPEVEYCITVPFPPVQVGNPSVSYKFRSQVFLHGDETGDRFGYLELTKDFLKSVGEVYEDGQVQFRIFIQFMKYES